MNYKNKKINLALKILFHIFFVMFALISVAGPILLGNASMVNGFLGIVTETGSGAGSGEDGNIYYDTKFKNMQEVREASLDIIEETMKEGAVLLKNDSDEDGNAALPLGKGDSVTLYGAASYWSVHTGQGSSGVEDGALNDRVTFYDGLTNAGLTVNGEMNEYYKNNGGDSSVLGTGGSDFIGADGQETQFVTKDIAWDSLPEAKNSDADAAVFVIARNSGEAVDLYMDTTMENGDRVIVSKRNNNNPSGSVGDSLSLTENEKSVLAGLTALKQAGTIDKIIVIMNCASPFQCQFLEDEAYDIDACAWVGTIGTNGATAIGKLLTGEYNFSGKTTDTFWEESKYNPVYYNFGSIEYGNSGALQNYFATLSQYNNKFYVVYQEGIYNGYKYTETRYEDYVTGAENAGEFDYSEAVTYPFGYGLSYSEFSYSNMNVKDNGDGTYTVSVDVTNNSEADGKEAVQIYVQKPYTELDRKNGVEKPSVELIGFDKVEVAAGATVTATATVQEKYFASYDADVEKTYVIGSDDADDEYLLIAAKNAHDAVNSALAYKGYTPENTDGRMDGTGDVNMVWGKHIAYDNTTYSTNEFIESQNENFTPDYEGQQANYGVSKITNQFEDVDFKKAGIFTDEEEGQSYLSRSNWTGTYGIRIELTANETLALEQENPAVEEDDIEYPTYDEVGFYESADTFDEVKLIYLRGKDYDDPLWDTLLDRMSYAETCALLQDGLRLTHGVESIAAPSTSQQNGALAPVHARTYGQLPSQSGFRGFAEDLDPENQSQKPAVFCCNGIVAATYNTDLIERLGEQTGEESIWAGYNGIYGLGVNIHRGAYCGRTFEYYSEDGFLTGVAAGYETVGLHKLGVFVLAKHAVLNDQETHRAGLNVWANEQTIREIYSRALEVAIEIEREYIDAPMLGVMTGMNRIGATWTGGQGFINTVLRAEYGMRGYAISDYNSSRPYMSPIQGVLYGNDLADGNPAGARGGYDYDGNDIRFASYESGYGELAWSMRAAAKNILYTVVNSNAMNGITGDMSFSSITPAWQTAVPVVTRVAMTLFIWSAVLFGLWWLYGLFMGILDDYKNKNANNNNGNEYKF